jgi:hypothetical protein
MGNRFMTLNSDVKGSKVKDTAGYFIEGRIYGNAEIKYRNGNEFEGQLKNFLRHGHGRMVYNTLDSNTPFINSIGRPIYEGKWSRDKRNGEGQIKYDSGLKYTGKWVNDSMYKGTLTSSTGKGYFMITHR